MSNNLPASPSPSPNQQQNYYNVDSLDERIQLAIKFCENNKPDQLQNIIKSGINVNTVIPQYKFKNVRRTNVPLISIAVSYNSLDCVKRLVQLNADIEAQDIFLCDLWNFIFLFFNTVFFI